MSNALSVAPDDLRRYRGFMRVTYLGHACLLIESDYTRVLIDPGTYSEGFESLRDLDAIAVTHLHPDHVDPERFPELARVNPGARLLIEPEAIQALAIGPANVFAAGAVTTVGGIRIEAVGGRHASNHDQVSPLGNVGLILTDSAKLRLFHPGDSYDETPGDIDVLGLPLSAPWCRMSETLDFLRAVKPKVAIPIHDGLLNEAGHGAYLMHVETFGPAETTARRLSVGATFDAEQ